MGKIRKFSTRTIHDVPLVFEDEQGKRVEEKFTVVYRSYSNKMLAEQKGLLNAEGETEISALLGLVVVRIADSEGQELTDESGDVATLSTELFAAWSLENTNAIYKGIQADVNPPTPSSTPGPSGSDPAGSEG
jgi:hypothetical protein